MSRLVHDVARYESRKRVLATVRWVYPPGKKLAAAAAAAAAAQRATLATEATTTRTSWRAFSEHFGLVARAGFVSIRVPGS